MSECKNQPCTITIIEWGNLRNVQIERSGHGGSHHKCGEICERMPLPTLQEAEQNLRDAANASRNKRIEEGCHPTCICEPSPRQPLGFPTVERSDETIEDYITKEANKHCNCVFKLTGTITVTKTTFRGQCKDRPVEKQEPRKKSK